MLIRLDGADRRPLHEQVASALRRTIAEGRCPAHLPPARDLARVLGINVNTVLRALRELRDEGLLEFRRGRGISLAAQEPSPTPPAGPPLPTRAWLLERARALVAEAERAGYQRTELVRVIEELP
jgi:GntR family transcriptional regulator